jgi:hypothetical protein
MLSGQIKAPTVHQSGGSKDRCPAVELVKRSGVLAPNSLGRPQALTHCPTNDELPLLSRPTLRLAVNIETPLGNLLPRLQHQRTI